VRHLARGHLAACPKPSSPGGGGCLMCSMRDRRGRSGLPCRGRDECSHVVGVIIITRSEKPPRNAIDQRLTSDLRRDHCDSHPLGMK
jgi:hypothetical protein